jgi:DNA-binding IscR family transcriptional regulator
MKRRHVNVPYALLDLKEANETKYTLVAILSFRSKRSKKIKVSLPKIIEVTGLKGRQLTKHINKLVKHGMVSRNQTKYGGGEYSCNTYTILCNEEYFAEIPWEIARSETLSVWDKIGYCIMKRFIDLDKKDFSCYLTKKELVEHLHCSPNQVDKVKRNLKKASLIEFERNSNKITLVYEHSLEETPSNNKTEIKKAVRKKIR